MNVDFLFEKEFTRIVNLKTTYKGDLKTTKALFLIKTKQVIVNLNYEYWLFLKVIGGEEYLIDEISKTLCHEGIHYAISECDCSVSETEYEEHICRIMAEQEGLKFDFS